MIDVGDPDILVAMFTRAAKLAQLDDRRLENELQAIHTRAAAVFAERGDDELSAYFAADSIVTRLRGLVANHRRRREAGGGAINPADWGGGPARGSNFLPCKTTEKSCE